MARQKEHFPKELEKDFSPISFLGKGASAAVWEVKRKSDGFVCALKLFDESLSLDAVSQKRFLREKELAGKSLHPNLIKIYSGGREQNRMYLLMERVQGESLKDKLQSHRPLPTKLALNIARKLALCLGKLHQANIVHRDVKPDNIFIESDDNPRLLDLGIARDLGGEKLTKTGMIIGSPFYMSPQLCRGEKAKAADDVFALGMTLLQCLSPKNPSDKFNSVVELMNDRAKKNWRPALPMGCGGAVNRLLRRLTAGDASKRAQDGHGAAKEIERTIASLTKERPVEETLSTEGTKSENKSRLRTAPLVVLTLFLLSFFTYTFYPRGGTKVKVKAPLKVISNEAAKKEKDWPVLPWLVKLSTLSQKAKAATTASDWQFHGIVDEGQRLLKKIARIRWRPKTISKTTEELLVIVPRRFYINVSNTFFKKAAFTFPEGIEYIPYLDEQERETTVFLNTHGWHNGRQLPPKMAKWYAEGKQLAGLVKENMQNNIIGSAMRTVSNLCEYMAVRRKDDEFNEMLSKLQKEAKELRKLSANGANWATLFLQMNLSDQAIILMLLEHRGFDDSKNSQIDKLARESEILAPTWTKSKHIPLGVHMALMARLLVIRRLINASTGPMALSNLGSQERINQYLSLAYDMVRVQMNIYKEPHCVPHLHLRFLQANWGSNERNERLRKEFTPLVEKSYEQGYINKMPYRR